MADTVEVLAGMFAVFMGIFGVMAAALLFIVFFAVARFKRFRKALEKEDELREAHQARLRAQLVKSLSQRRGSKSGDLEMKAKVLRRLNTRRTVV